MGKNLEFKFSLHVPMTFFNEMVESFLPNNCCPSSYISFISTELAVDI